MCKQKWHFSLQFVTFILFKLYNKKDIPIHHEPGCLKQLKDYGRNYVIYLKKYVMCACVYIVKKNEWRGLAKHRLLKH